MRGRHYFMVSLAIMVLVGIVAASGQAKVGSVDAQVAPAPLAQTVGSSLGVTVSVSKPANGTHFVAGERPVLTVTLKDKNGAALSKNEFATLGLYAYGPQAPTKTVTASKLLNAVTDRSKTPHHYINLLAEAGFVQECCTPGQTRPSGVQGNVFKYTLQPVSDEQPGTYTVSLRAVLNGTPPVGQDFALADFQLGTPVVETQVVEKEKCAACHLGAASGQFYFRHVDPTASNAYGSPSIDSWPVRTCKSCHNNDGYAAYSGNIADPTGPSTARTPDPIVRRVHGVHMGEDLKNTFNTDSKTGNFRDFTSIVFPADVRNCTVCHVDERWKTQVSRQACGACHDAIWFGETAAMPTTFKQHPGGPQASDANCTQCHTADGPLPSVTAAHKVSLAVNPVDVSLTPPANGKFYTTGDKPTVTIVIKDDAGNPIDHTKVDVANFSNAGLFVYGPREQSKPVLTSAAKNGISKLRASISNSIAAAGSPTRGWTFAAGDTFRIAVNGGAPVVLSAPAGLQTPNQVRDWLASKLSDVTVTATATNVTIRSNLQGDKSRIEIYNSPVTTVMGWKQAGLPIDRGGVTAGVTMEPYVIIGQSSYMINDLRKLSDPLDYSDPAVTRNVANITYQLDEVKGLAPGTYLVQARYAPVASKNATLANAGLGLTTFQVGAEKAELKVATNCTQCHGDTRMHSTLPFDTDYCKACHDYARHSTGDNYARLGGTSLSGWSGFGVPPIARRVHGVHRGRYLDYPEQIYGGNPNVFAEVIFPQDIRNCEKCHDPKTTTAAWKENPSRLACMACHDSDKANAHAKLMTENTTGDPWSSDRTETCAICHGKGRDFAVEKMHNISSPYVPPYAREPE